MRLLSSLSIIAACCTVTLAHAATFTDVPASNPAYTAIEALSKANILKGYADGTFRPDKLVNRAEAVKMITAPHLTPDQLAQATSTAYTDIPKGTWYLPYVEWARQAFRIIQGPPQSAKFYGERPVILSEFLKMTEVSNGIDPASQYANVQLPLSGDVQNVNDWFYPYMRYALSASMVDIDQSGKLNPSGQLTRADTALLLYNFLAYNQNQRTQVLLNTSERNMVVILQAWNQGSITEAEYASARAMLAAYGAHASRPDDPATKGAVKVAEAFRALVEGYRAGVEKNYTLAAQRAGDAWKLCDAAVTQYPDIQALADQIKAVAKTVADSARALTK